MKKLPIGIQTFRKIVEGNNVYVDKTKYIYDLIKNGNCYFLSRPRRFGKSLLLDTIAEVFKGSKELFKGLWIYDSDYDFASHSVIRLDMSNVDTKTPDVFEKSLAARLRYVFEEEGILFSDDTPPGLLINLIKGLYKKHNQRVVVLIDEYDKPILDHITDFETAEANRAILRSFYGILKSLDSYIAMTFFTGVSKFIKTSVFSSLNNLTDITMNRKYANICGILVDDLEKYFGDRIKDLATQDIYKDRGDMHSLILSWYDGYSWDGKTKLLNPYGLLSFFVAEEFKSFWFVSGSPKFLIDLIKNKPDVVPNLQNLTICEADMDAIDILNMTIGPLLFQTGYLTVAKIVYPDVWPEYVLEIPNFEVRQAFYKHLTAGLTEQDHVFVSETNRQINKALSTGDLQSVLTVLRSLFAAIPHQLHVDKEAYYHSIFISVMHVLGFKIDAEVSVSKGRIDAVLELGDKVYVFEFKYQACPPNADESEKRELSGKALKQGMKQIADRGYADKYKGSGKKIYQAAFAFLGRDNVEMESHVIN